jgi:hypothetical protein
MNVGGFFVVGNLEVGFLKGAQLLAEFPQASFVADAGKQFLADGAHELSAPIADEFPQCGGETLLTGAQVDTGSPQRERPDGVWSRLLAAALGFVIVVGIEVHGAKRPQNAKLLVAFDVFGEGRGDRFFFGLVTTGAAGCFDQLVIQGQVGRHV